MKSYWNDKLKELSRDKKQAWYLWRVAGKPRGDNKVYREYMNAKKTFKAEQRRAQTEYERKKIQSIASADDMNQTKFWHFVNKCKSQGRVAHILKLGVKQSVTKQSNVKNGQLILRSCISKWINKIIMLNPKQRL